MRKKHDLVRCEQDGQDSVERQTLTDYSISGGASLM